MFNQIKHMMHKINAVLLCRHLGCHRNLRSKWQGPYHVIDTSPHGAITIQDDDGNAYKVNGQRLKLFLDHNKALDEVIDVTNLIYHALISK